MAESKESNALKNAEKEVFLMNKKDWRKPRKQTHRTYCDINPDDYYFAIENSKKHK